VEHLERVTKQVTNLMLRHVWSYEIDVVGSGVHNCIVQPRTWRGPAFRNDARVLAVFSQRMAF
jgi:hypothetical protein